MIPSFNRFPHMPAADLSVLLADQTPATAEQLAAVRAEIASDPTGRGYAGRSAAEVLLLINSPYSAENPETQTRVARTRLTPDQFRVFRTSIMAAWANTAPTLREAFRDLVTVVIPSLSDFEGVDLSNPSIIEGLALLEEKGVISAQTVAAFTSEPDPNYQATLVMPSRAESLLGAGILIDLSDLAQVGIK